MRRESDFVEFPGTGMWAIVRKNDSSLTLWRHISPDQVDTFVGRGDLRIFWMDQGTGVSTLLRVINGGKSASITEVTLAILRRYLR